MKICNTRITQQYVRALRRDPCCYCSETVAEVTIDHIAPRSPGKGQERGRGNWENLTGACKSCNRAKGNTKLLFYLMQCQTLTAQQFLEAARRQRDAKQNAKQAARFFKLGNSFRMAS